MNLAFPICAIKMYSKHLFIPLKYIGGHTLSPCAFSNWENGYLSHKFKQAERNFKQLVMNQTWLPDSSKHRLTSLTA